MQERGPDARRGFLSPPSTPLGRVSAILLLAAVALIVVNVIFFDAPNEIGPAWLGNVVAFGIGASVLLALATGAIALIRNRERSWVVWVSTALPAAVVLFEIVEALVPGP